MKLITQFYEQPRALRILFFAEVWERLSFYGMRALLVLYMTKHFMYDDEKSYHIYGSYGALVYASPVLGGYLADKLLGYRHSVLIGAGLMSLGHLCMAFPGDVSFFYALALIALGNGFFKPNIGSLVGALYAPGDARRDTGFLIFYLGVNLGAVSAGFLGLVGETYGWHLGFGLAGVGMVIGMAVFYFWQSWLGTAGMRIASSGTGAIIPGVSNVLVVVLGTLLLLPGLVWVLHNHWVLTWLLGTVAAVSLSYVLRHAFAAEKVVREKIFAALVLIVASTVFWSFFEQAGSSLNLFADRAVNREVAGAEIKASVFQSVNPVFIILLVPVFSWIWTMLRNKNAEPGIPVKFVLAMLLMGCGFAVLYWGAAKGVAGVKVPLMYLIGGYFLQTAGELCLSPVGMSMITKLAPSRLTSIMMGMWFLSHSFAHHIGGWIAGLTALPQTGIESVQNAGGAYAPVFSTISLTALGAALLLLILVPVLNRWMHGVK